MQNRILLFSLLLVLTIFVITPIITHAKVNPLQILNNTVGSGADIKSYNSGTNIQSLVGTIISTFLSILGVIFLILTVYGGYLWMTAQGAEEEVTKAKKLITQAVIGLAIVMGAYAISYFVTKNLESATAAATIQQTGTSTGDTGGITTSKSPNYKAGP